MNMKHHFVHYIGKPGIFTVVLPVTSCKILDALSGKPFSTTSYQNTVGYPITPSWYIVFQCAKLMVSNALTNKKQDSQGITANVGDRTL